MNSKGADGTGNGHKSDAYYTQHTRNWVEKAVIGLGLCPFAARPYQQNQVRFTVCHAAGEEEILKVAKSELDVLIGTSQKELETSLLILPEAFPDFLDFNDFLEKVDGLVVDSGKEGIIQVATFHPWYLFAEFPPGDPSHYTNRSPYPMLHFLREESVSWAVDTHPNVHAIPDDNIHLMKGMGMAKIKNLWRGFHPNS